MGRQHGCSVVAMTGKADVLRAEVLALSESERSRQLRTREEVL